MMRNNNFKTSYSMKGFLQGSILLITGLFLGWLFFHGPSGQKDDNHQKAESTKIWTCSMHPQIHQAKPGKCPLCGMDLIELNQGSEKLSDETISLDEIAMKIADIQTTVIRPGQAIKEVRLYGKIKPDERTIQIIPAHISGRIEALLVNFTGEKISRGQVVARIYSPELLTARQELLEAKMNQEHNPQLLSAAREKLRQWKLSDHQIQQLENEQNPVTFNELHAPVSGVVTNRLVNMGDYVNRGQSLYEVVDLSRVWIIFDAYEADLPWIHLGSGVTFEVEALPGKTFSGTVKFVDPVINPQTRVAGVRLEVDNPEGLLKPEMFATGYIHTQLSGKSQLLIPKSAVLWTGKRSVTYLKISGTDKPAFQKKDITLGAETGEGYIVLDGLKAGDEVVTNGTFAVDAAAQLEGKSSMMNSDDSEKTEDPKPSKLTTQIKPMEIKEQTGISKSEIKVEGLCDMCKERIETAAKSVHGVLSAQWSVETHILKLNYTMNSKIPDQVQKAVASAGHDTEKYKARDEVYKALPECCLYRK